MGAANWVEKLIKNEEVTTEEVQGNPGPLSEIGDGGEK